MVITVGQCDNAKRYHIHDTSDNGVRTLCKRFAFDCQPIDWVNKEDVCKLCLMIQRNRYCIPKKEWSCCDEADLKYYHCLDFGRILNKGGSIYDASML
jgi:hypothetical protein